MSTPARTSRRLTASCSVNLATSKMYVGRTLLLDHCHQCVSDVRERYRFATWSYGGHDTTIHDNSSAVMLFALFGLLPAILAALAYATLGEPFRPVFRRHRVKVAPTWPALSIVHISDLHV